MQLQRRGFSLIELLVVISIAGVLSAIAIPAYRQYRVKAATVRGLNYLNTFRTQIESTYQRTGTFPASLGGLTFNSNPQYLADGTSLGYVRSSSLVMLHIHVPAETNLNGTYGWITLAGVPDSRGNMTWTCGSWDATYFTASNVPTTCRSNFAGTLPASTFWWG